MEEPLIQEECSTQSSSKARKEHHGFKLSFVLLFWIVFGAFMIFAIVDRYTSMLWLAGVE